MHVQCWIVKKDPFYVNFWTSLMPPLDIQVALPPGIELLFNIYVAWLMM